MYLYNYDDTYAEISRVEEDRSVTPVLRFVFVEADNVPEYDGNQHEVLRLICYLLDGLAVRDAEGLAPADWVEIGTDDEDEPDLYAEGYDAGYSAAVEDDDGEGDAFHATIYDEGFRDGYREAFRLLLGDVDQVSEEDEEDEDEFFRAKSYDEGFRDGSAAAFALAIEDAADDLSDEDELSDEDYCWHGAR